MASGRWLLAILLGGCAAPNEDPALDVANVDTSGCSVNERASSEGPVRLAANPVPRNACWNAGSAGLTVTYAWLQTNDATPRKDNVGFWTAINGSGVYAKADAYRCERVAAFGLGHATDGEQTFRCTASRMFRFEQFPELAKEAYANGQRREWAAEAAVSLDDAANWDSKNGANYRFVF
jgi:hypothetical protein